MSDPDAEAVVEALHSTESKHQFHGNACLCGFTSDVARARTAHITRDVLGEPLGHKFVAEATEGFPQ